MRESSRPRPRVLVAEDNRANQKLAEAMLDKLGYDARVVGTGADAVEAVLASHYDAVIMDCRMPRMDGLQATTEIRKREMSSRRTPIIALTGSAEREEREKCLAVGMDDHIVKPVRMEELRLALERCVPAPAPGPAAATGRSGVSAANAVIDPDRLVELKALDRPEGPTAISMLADIFLRDAPDRLAALQRSVLEGDAVATREVAHLLRGAAINLGAARVASVCGEIERAARSEDLASVPDLLKRLEPELADAREALQEEVARE